ncbi:MAG: hypothetical protein QM765_03555 [Myxococcales bacterium]
MGTLATFDGFLADRLKVAGEAQARLTALQAKFESFFAEITAVREAELEQLGKFVGAGQLPPALAKSLEAARAKAEAEFEDQLAVLKLERDELAEKAEAIRKKSMSAEVAVHQKNVDLDAAEEKLKARNEVLLAAIERYNASIRELSTGFGFFANILKMRKLHGESLALQKEQADVAAQIESTRAAWAARDAAWSQSEAEARKAWVEARTKVSAAQTKSTRSSSRGCS